MGHVGQCTPIIVSEESIAVRIRLFEIRDVNTPSAKDLEAIGWDAHACTNFTKASGLLENCHPMIIEGETDGGEETT
jgi:hypothetical protein